MPLAPRPPRHAGGFVGVKTWVAFGIAWLALGAFGLVKVAALLRG